MATAPIITKPKKQPVNQLLDPLALKMLSGPKAAHVGIEINKDGSLCTDGQTVYIPNYLIKDPNSTVNVLRGALDHETAHINYTDFEVSKGLNPRTFGVLNMLEDFRIDMRRRKEGKGFAVNQNALNRFVGNHLCETRREKLKERPDIQASFLIYKELFGMELGEGESVITSDAVKMKDIALPFAKKAIAAKSTAEVIPLAVELDRLWYGDPPDKSGKKSSGESKSGKSNSDSKKNESDGSGKSQEKPADERQKEQDKAGKDDDKDGDGAAGDAEDENDTEDGEDANGNSKTGDGDNDESDSFSGNGLGDGEEEKDGNAEGDTTSGNAENDSDKSETGIEEEKEVVMVLSPNDSGLLEARNIEFIVKDIKRIVGQISDKLPVYIVPDEIKQADSVIDVMYWLQKMAKDPRYASILSAADREYKSTLEKYKLDSLSGVVNHLKQYFRSAIQTQTRSRNVVKQYSGKIDRRRMAQIKTDTRIFKRKTDAIDLDTTITLLVDYSGSMIGWKLAYATMYMNILAELCDFAGIPFEIIGFTTAPASTSVRAKIKEGRSVGLLHYIIKDAAVPFKRIRPYMKYVINRRNGISSLCLSASNGTTAPTDVCNADGESLLFAADRIKKRRESRKIIIVISDGQPSFDYRNDSYYSNTPYGTVDNAQYHLHYVINTLRREGLVELYAVGLLNQGVSDFYGEKYSINITSNDIKFFSVNFFKKFVNILQRGTI
jgi:cobaltochelatase CobT